jgi:hypothetical protein
MFQKVVFRIQLTIFSLAFLSISYAQEIAQKTTIDWSGFVNVDYIFDTRQTISGREGGFLFFPAPVLLDIDGQDINATPSFNILAIRTRLKASISGPDFFHFKTSAVIEGDFSGQSNEDINGVRLRHAWLKLSGKKIDLLLGQNWHPMFVTACFPETYSFNTGVPFQPISRNPQFRISTKGKWKAVGVFYTQRDFASRGPGGTSSDYLRHSALPGMHGQLQYESEQLTFGLGTDFKVLKPGLIDGKGNKSDEMIPSLAFLSWMKIELPIATFKAKAIWGENLSDLLMIGSIAEMDAESGFCNSTTLSFWSELSGEKGWAEWGLFGGYSKNLGPDHSTTGPVYGLGTDIQYLYRIAPRFGLKSGKTTIGLEVEYTTAQYGAINKYALNPLDLNINPVSNTRFLMYVMYKF